MPTPTAIVDRADRAIELRSYATSVTPIRHAALAVLLERDPELKARKARELHLDGPIGESELIAEPTGVPGRPERPQLVPHTDFKQRSVKTRPGRAALIHALAHIELNAVDLAVDIVWRFAGMPPEFYRQ
jgi:uncharacterized ferritin-like protein (DUF455 family)